MGDLSVVDLLCPGGPSMSRTAPISVRRIATTWSSIGDSDHVASCLEHLAAKIRMEGDPVDLKATLRYESKALKEKGLIR